MGRDRDRDRERKREKDELVEEEQGSLHRENGEKREDKKSKRKKLEHSSDSYSESDSEGSESSESEEEDRRRHKRTSKKRRSSSKRRHEHSDSGSSSYESESECSDSEEERRRRKRRERKKREEREKEKERKRRRREKRRRRDEEDEKRRKKRKDKEKKKEKGKKGAVTNSWGKFGIIREVDMWNKRPEFTAWLMEVKEVNLESLPIYEEKKMFKEYMEDYNTATFPSKKYYNLDAYHKEKMEKEMRKGMKKVVATEMTVFNDEEQRRLELLQVREKQKQQEVESLKVAMQSGMAQAMKEQARLREEMQYLFKIGSHEAAAAIQRRLDPDVPM